MPSLTIEKYIVDEKGNPTAVILPLNEYKKMLSLLEDVKDRSREFTRGLQQRRAR